MPTEGPLVGFADDVVTDLVRHATDALDATCWAATERIFAEVTAYGNSADPQIAEQVALHCRTTNETFLQCVTQRRWSAEKDFPLAAANALNRVAQGVSLADYLRAFRLAQDEFWRSLVVIVTSRDIDRGVLVDVATVLMQVFEVGSSVAARSYLEAAQYRLANRDRILRDLMEDLLAGRDPTIEPRRQILRDVGLLPDGDLAVVTARPGDDDDAALQSLRTHLNRLDAGEHGLIVPRHDEVVAVLPVRRTTFDALPDRLNDVREFLRAKGSDVAFGISGVHRGWAGIAEAYREAQVARHGLEHSGGVRSLAQMSVLDYFVATQNATARGLIDARVRAFVEEELAGDGAYLETLKAYVASDLNAKVAADRLHLHVNTAYYRLDRVSERTGHDLRRLDEVLDLMIAVAMLEQQLNR